MPRGKTNMKKTKGMKTEMHMHDHEADGCCGGMGCGNGHWHKGCMGSIYGLGFIGAVVFYIQAATGFWAGVLGVIKAIFWPAFLVYKLFGI